MKYIVPNSKTGLANKFVDYILSEIDKNNDSFTVLEVVIFNEFFVINGLTSVKDRIDLNEIKQKFYDENKSLLSFLCFDSINTIDLIKYDSPIHEFNMCFDFHSSYRPLYHEKVLEYVYNHQNIQWEYIDFHNSLTLGIDYRLEKPNHESYISEFGGVKITVEQVCITVNILQIIYSQYVKQIRLVLNLRNQLLTVFQKLRLIVKHHIL
jgi:hypothetical protein